MSLVPKEQSLLELGILGRACALGLIRAGRVELCFDGIALLYPLRARRAR